MSECLHFFIHIEFQVRGTVFNELDDEKLFSVIDFLEFEEQFKIGLGGGTGKANGDMSEVDSLHAFGSKRIKKSELTSLMEHTRLRNIGKEAADAGAFVIYFVPQWYGKLLKPLSQYLISIQSCKFKPASQ